MDAAARDAARRVLQSQIPYDPLSPIYPHYKPSPNQGLFHQSDAYYKLVRGGGRSGKTTACVVDMAWCLRGIHPYKKWCGPFMALAFCVTRQQAAMVVGRKLIDQCEFPPIDRPDYPDIGQHPLIPKWEIEDIGHTKIGFRVTVYVKLKNGCQLYFQWSDQEETWKRIQGPKIGYIYIDENAGNRKLIIEGKKRLQDSQHPGTWHGCMVWGGHATEDNDAFSEYRELCERKIASHELFHLNAGETGAVDAAATARFAESLTPEERKIHIDGTGEAADLVRIFINQWNAERNTTAAAYVPNPEDNLWAAYDPGVDHPMGLLIGTISRTTKQLTVVKCWNRKGGTIHDDAHDLAMWLNGRKLAGFVYDTNLKNKDRAGGPSVLDQLKAALRDRGVVVHGWWQSKKNHAPGINLVREWLVRGTLLVCTEKSAGGQMLVSQLLKYKGKESTKFTGEGGVVKKDDELVDAVRYLAMCLDTIGIGWRSDWMCGQTITEILDEPEEDDWNTILRERGRAAIAYRSRRGETGGFREIGEPRQSKYPLPPWLRRPSE